MNDEIEVKVRQRVHEMGEGENHPDGQAEQHRLEAERVVTKEAENAAISRWAAPVSGSYVENCNEAARSAKTAREAAVVARESAAESPEQPITVTPG